MIERVLVYSCPHIMWVPFPFPPHINFDFCTRHPIRPCHSLSLEQSDQSLLFDHLNFGMQIWSIGSCTAATSLAHKPCFRTSELRNTAWTSWMQVWNCETERVDEKVDGKWCGLMKRRERKYGEVNECGCT